MYGKQTVVHESGYFIQARREPTRRAAMLTWNAKLRQLLPHASLIISKAGRFARINSTNPDKM
jgi:hypothetical protein